MTDLITSLFSSAPVPQGESARIRSLVDAEGARPWLQAQITLRGGGTIGGCLTTHESGLLRLVTPQATKEGLLIVDQYFAASDVAMIATVIEPPRVATRSSGIVLG